MLKKAINEAEERRFGPFRLDSRGLFLTRRGRPVEAPRRSLALLARLTEEPGRVIPRAELTASAWGSTHVSPTSLGEAVSRLRAALDDDPRSPTYIETVHGRGYRFVGAVRPDRGIERRGGWLAALTAVALGVLALGILETTASRRPDTRRLARLSTEGAMLRTLSLPAMEIVDIAVSPDGERVALSVASGPSAAGRSGSDLWLYEPASESLRRLTDGGENLEMVWSPDNDWLVYAKRGRSGFDLVRQRVAVGAEAEALLEAPGDQYPESFSSDGRQLIYSQATADSGLDLALLRRQDDGRWVAGPLRSTPAHEYLASVAPGDRRIAFVSDVSGRWEAYVQRLVSGAVPVRVSRGGARDVFWSADGAVHYLADDGLVRVTLDTEASAMPRARQRFELPVRIERIAPAPDGGLLATVLGAG
jgi:DNA-binding winged helix-turn-helix (wHTH) protein